MYKGGCDLDNLHNSTPWQVSLVILQNVGPQYLRGCLGDGHRDVLLLCTRQICLHHQAKENKHAWWSHLGGDDTSALVHRRVFVVVRLQLLPRYGPVLTRQKVLSLQSAQSMATVPARGRIATKHIHKGPACTDPSQKSSTDDWKSSCGGFGTDQDTSAPGVFWIYGTNILNCRASQLS